MENEALAAAYLKDIRRTYRNYKALGEKAMAQVRDDAALHAQLDAESNSIAIIVKHLTGNLRSRFRDFLTSDGEKPDRRRDDEFEMPDRVSRAELLRWWEDAWAITLGAIDALRPEDLERTIHIRGEAFVVVEALNRNATHTAYHVGQIVFLAKHLEPGNWKSLSIPKGRSVEFSKGDFKTTGIARDRG